MNLGRSVVRLDYGRVGRPERYFDYYIRVCTFKLPLLPAWAKAEVGSSKLS